MRTGRQGWSNVRHCGQGRLSAGLRDRSGPHVRCDPASRSGRLGLLHRGRRRAGYAAAEHHRPRRRPSADVQRGRLGRPRLQRRDLQFRGAAERPARARPRPSHPQRHRGAGPLVRGGGRGLLVSPPRHVRVRALGPAPPPPAARSRPFRAEAAVLHRVRRAPGLRVRDQGAPHRRSVPPDAQPLRPRSVPRAPVRERARHPVREDQEASTRPLPGVGRRARHGGTLLGPELREQVELLGERYAGPGGGAARRGGPAAPRQRRTRGCLPERRPRLHAHRGIRRADPRRRAPHLLDGYPPRHPKRAAGSRSRGGAVRHTAPRRGDPAQRDPGSASPGLGAGRAG